MVENFWTKCSINERKSKQCQNLSYHYLKSAKIGQAVEQLFNAMLYDPKFAARRRIAFALFDHSDDKVKYCQQIESIVNIHPDDLHYRYLLALSYCVTVCHSKALKQLDYTLSSNPKNYATLLVRGYVYWQENQIQQCIEDLVLLIKESPEYMLKYLPTDKELSFPIQKNDCLYMITKFLAVPEYSDEYYLVQKLITDCHMI